LCVYHQQEEEAVSEKGKKKALEAEMSGAANNEKAASASASAGHENKGFGEKAFRSFIHWGFSRGGMQKSELPKLERDFRYLVLISSYSHAEIRSGLPAVSVNHDSCILPQVQFTV
jgi:hypothetical protein